MALIRLFLLLVVLGCLTLLLMQNWSPVLPLRFLGVQSQPLPLAVWILFAVVAGAITALFITACFKVSNLFASSDPQRRKQVKASPKRTTRTEAPRSSQANYTTSTDQSKNSTSSDNEWESNSSNDWNFEEDAQDTIKNPKTEPKVTVRDYTNSEANTETYSSDRSTSYSYSSRDPSNSGVGKTESVYDADYRVLTPPHRQTNTQINTNQNQNQNNEDWGDEDWGFEDDEDWQSDEDKSSPQRR